MKASEGAEILIFNLYRAAKQYGIILEKDKTKVDIKEYNRLEKNSQLAIEMLSEYIAKIENRIKELRK